jgi:hypothetical protein
MDALVFNHLNVRALVSSASARKRVPMDALVSNHLNVRALVSSASVKLRADGRAGITI